MEAKVVYSRPNGAIIKETLVVLKNGGGTVASSSPTTTTTTTTPLLQSEKQTRAFKLLTKCSDRCRAIPFTVLILLSSSFLSLLSSSHLSLPATATMATTSIAEASVAKEVSNVEFQLTEEMKLPHVVFGDTAYRRVCENVQSSILCMTLRHPMPFPVQDPNKTYTYPFDERLNVLRTLDFRFIDGEELAICQQRTAAGSNNNGHVQDEDVKDCLDRAAAASSSNDIEKQVIVAVWTKHRNKVTSFFGTQFTEQRRNIDKYFDNEILIVIGASPSPQITLAISELFGNCIREGKVVKRYYPSYLCQGWYKNKTQTYPSNYTRTPFGAVPVGNTFIANKYYAPTRTKSGFALYKPKDIVHPLSAELGDPTPPVWKGLRNLTMIIEYPLAHVQTQQMIQEQWTTIQATQKGFPALVLHAMSPEGKEKLAALGYNMRHMIAFDGMPQFFPTETGAFVPVAGIYKGKEYAIAHGMYPGWIPDYGTECRGPLSPKSKLKEVNDLARQRFEQLGLDMGWYGRTWEFTNLFWFNFGTWGRHVLDCTHGGMIISSVHKFFLQSMVDDVVV